MLNTNNLLQGGENHMCAPIVLPDAAIGLAAAHLIGVGLLAGIVVFNSNGVRKSMANLIGFGEDSDTIVTRFTSFMSR